MRATERLTRNLLVLAPARVVAGWRLPALAAALAASLFVASHVHREALPWASASAAPAGSAFAMAAPAFDPAPLRKQIDQAELALQLSRAQAQELERQVDALNQRLRETQEELAFFRHAREPRSRETRRQENR